MLTSCTQMHRLKMDECHGVTAASILALSVHCQSVQMLDVTGCDNVPETSVKAAAGVSVALSKGWSSGRPSQHCEPFFDVRPLSAVLTACSTRARPSFACAHVPLSLLFSVFV